MTLKPQKIAGRAAGFELDLRTPDAHKTAAIFGPSVTPVPPAACALLKAWLAAAGLAPATKPYVFVLGGRGRVPGAGCAVDHAQALSAPHWTKVVQGVHCVPHRDGAAASPTGARTARRRQRPEDPRAKGVLLACSRGDKWGGGT